MKKTVIAGLAAMALSGCAASGSNGGDISAQQLQHHRYVLQTLDGRAVNSKAPHQPEISFGENMHVSGQMCNRFMGQGKLNGNTLTVDGMASTRMMCIDPQLNQLDGIIGEMLNHGAQLSLTGKQLTLTSPQHTLTWTLSDLVQ
ncbi:heat shock protein HslJ [Shimwellia pseudoproteus]|uniref:heat shock protein HslJ n=1 Tax=Shimwellia pseudoproteus TaxID=570012 RepID=UPI0018EE3CEB|nr:heat shock protein HslJ [Shimwellia pseudoproteus]MBJ3816532.1 heat shock protein HslJ [Shimwellia pseudoproteus]